jgi:hypothetical protein
MLCPIPLLALAALVALAAALLSEARAADADLPAIDPPGHWRLMTQDPDTTSSKCVGDPKTPLCAVETIRACFIRRDDNLCRVGMGLDHPPGVIKSFKTPWAYEWYRIVDVKQLGEKDLRVTDTDPKYTDDPEYSPWAWRTGDVKIAAFIINCSQYIDEIKPARCQKHPLPPTTYIVRKEGTRWRVVDWDTPRMD